MVALDSEMCWMMDLVPKADSRGRFCRAGIAEHATSSRSTLSRSPYRFECRALANRSVLTIEFHITFKVGNYAQVCWAEFYERFGRSDPHRDDELGTGRIVSLLKAERTSVDG